MSSSAALLRWPAVLAVLLFWSPASGSLPIVTASLGEEGMIAVVVTPPAPDSFVIFHITPEAPVVLVDDYGLMLINEDIGGQNQKPQPRFIVACKSSRQLVDTQDLKIAALALSTIPTGRRIRWYDSCTMPRSYGLPASVHHDLQTAIKNSGLIILDEPNITCYCSE